MTSDEAIRAVVQAEGDQLLAAERLSCTVAELVAAIASDPAATGILNQQLRTLQTLQAFNTNRLASIMLNASLGDLEPKDLAKTVVQTADLVVRLTDSHTQTTNINIVEQTLRMLPPEIRDAVTQLIELPATASAPATAPPNPGASRSTGAPLGSRDSRDLREPLEPAVEGEYFLIESEESAA